MSFFKDLIGIGKKGKAPKKGKKSIYGGGSAKKKSSSLKSKNLVKGGDLSGSSSTPLTPVPTPSPVAPTTAEASPGPLQDLRTGPMELEPEVNRRRSKRVTIKEWAKVAIAGVERETAVVDVSEGGVRLAPSAMYQLYTQVKLNLPLPVFGAQENVLCTVKGVVVWTNKRGIGIKFKDLSEETLVQLRQFLETCLE